MLQKCVC